MNNLFKVEGVDLDDIPSINFSKAIGISIKETGNRFVYLNLFVLQMIARSAKCLGRMETVDFGANKNL